MKRDGPGIERLCWIGFIGLTLGWFLAGLPPQASAWLEPRGMLGLVAGAGLGMLIGLLVMHWKANRPVPRPVPVDITDRRAR